MIDTQQDEMRAMARGFVNNFGEPDDKYDGVSFGSIGDIKERAASCPFCEFLAHTIADYVAKKSEVSPLSDGRTIRIKWQTCYSPNLRVMWRIWREPTDQFALSERRYLTINNNFRELGIKIVAFSADVAQPWAFGKLIENNETFNPENLRRWIGACERWHQDTCMSLMPTKKKSVTVRLIDVTDNCLVRSQNTCRYLALSYQWGTCNSLQALRSNIAQLEKKGGLLDFVAVTPVTIQDAIILTRHLGERHLWVDALCIIQDDDDIKANEIANMDAIYNHALLTIIAGSGVDANAGLPGVRPGTRIVSQTVGRIRPDLRVTAVGEGTELLMKSRYSQRAWT